MKRLPRKATAALLIEQAWKAAVHGSGMAPSEFWKLSLREFWWLQDAIQAEHVPCGRLTDDELADLYEELKKCP